MMDKRRARRQTSFIHSSMAMNETEKGMWGGFKPEMRFRFQYTRLYNTPHILLILSNITIPSYPILSLFIAPASLPT